jgi:hypothetical protein
MEAVRGVMYVPDGGGHSDGSGGVIAAAMGGGEQRVWFPTEEPPGEPQGAIHLNFFISNTFFKLFPNLTMFFLFSNLTLLGAPIAMARQINADAPFMVAR